MTQRNRRRNGSRRPPLVAGETRLIVSLSMSSDQRDKLDRISEGNRSEFVRKVIDTWPEERK